MISILSNGDFIRSNGYQFGAIELQDEYNASRVSLLGEQHAILANEPPFDRMDRVIRANESPFDRVDMVVRSIALLLRGVLFSHAFPQGLFQCIQTPFVFRLFTPYFLQNQLCLLRKLLASFQIINPLLICFISLHQFRFKAFIYCFLYI